MKNNQPDAIVIMCKIFKKEIGYRIGNKPFNKIITPFVVNVFKQVGLA